jgi:hypothetical protein
MHPGAGIADGPEQVLPLQLDYSERDEDGSDEDNVLEKANFREAVQYFLIPLL